MTEATSPATPTQPAGVPATEAPVAPAATAAASGAPQVATAAPNGAAAQPAPPAEMAAAVAASAAAAAAAAASANAVETDERNEPAKAPAKREAKKQDADAEDTSMSEAEVMPEIQMAHLDMGEAAPGAAEGAAAVAAAGAQVVAAPVDYYEDDDGGMGGYLLPGLVILGTLGLGAALLLGDDDDGEGDLTPVEPPEVPNQAPLAADDDAVVDEDATVTGSVADNDSDPDGDPLTYELTGTVPAGLTLNSDGTFTFDATDPAYGELAEGETLDVVATYMVTDPDGATDTANLTITVTGTNDAPEITTGATATVPENADPLTVIYDADAVDPDGDALVYSLTGEDAEFFTIDPATGEVRLVESADFETRSSYTINVVATDPNGGSDVQEVVVNVEDIPENNLAPTFTAEPDVVVQENVPAGTVVFDADAVDPDGGAVTYSLSAESDAFFDIDPVTGVVTWAISPDFETQSEYEVEVVATDDEGDTAGMLVGVTVTDVDEGAGAQTVLLDAVDDDNNPNTVNLVDASDGAFIFLDDDDLGSFTFITGFGPDDQLVFEEGADVSFSTAADDPNDLQITVNNNGVVSEVILDDVLADGAGLIYNEATAETAVGFDFFSQAPIVDTNFA